MADEFVRIGQFEQFCRGNDQRFLDLEKKMEQGFAPASKERGHILEHLNQRFDDLKESLDHRFDAVTESVNHRFDGVNQRFDSLEKLLNWHNRILMGILLMILAGLVKYLFFQS
ncbi:MAG: hypothetical protein OXJ56_10115 [Rhodospirillaceae bacterium]|nr:hypothetical protein [Rhodospirillaceae bacterium]